MPCAFDSRIAGGKRGPMLIPREQAVPGGPEHKSECALTEKVRIKGKNESGEGPDLFRLKDRLALPPERLLP